ncbi:MAG TPA: alanine dehydrogenase, partial [Armatimonadota bacterium]|nr:alanine dehydrogenase [Armatimonadota bacterium]
MGIPKEIKPEEKRVAGLPEHVQRLRELGVDVLVQRDAGTASGHPDAEYERAGAELVETLEEVYARADLLWKVKEPLPPEYGLLRPDHIVFTYLHPAPRPRMVEALLAARCIAIAYEEVTDEQGRRPLLAPMSRIAGAGAIAIAAQFTQSIYGGVGKSLFTVEGADPMRVTILGGGTAGRTAAQAALGAGARITVLEASPEVATGLRRTFARACVELSSEDAIRRLLPETDVLVNCIYWMPGDPHLVTREMLALMPRGA